MKLLLHLILFLLRLGPEPVPLLLGFLFDLLYLPLILGLDDFKLLAEVLLHLLDCRLVLFLLLLAVVDLLAGLRVEAL